LRGSFEATAVVIWLATMPRRGSIDLKRTKHSIANFICKPKDHVFVNVDASADFISVHELSCEIIGKGSYLERGSTATGVNGVHLNPIKLIIGKNRDEVPGGVYGRNTHGWAYADWA